MDPVIWWIRRDLRLTDNPVLTAAREHTTTIIPLFILDPKLLNSRYASPKRQAFLFGGLRALGLALLELGSRLIVRQGNPVEELARLIYETGSSMVFAEPDFSPYAVSRDHDAAKQVPINWVGSPAIIPPGVVIKPDETAYTVFTPFSKAWKTVLAVQHPSLSPPPAYLPPVPELFSLPIPPFESNPLFNAGEVEAQARLDQFLRKQQIESYKMTRNIYAYADGRNRLDEEGTSGLSPYLRFGMLSPRQAAFAAGEAIQSAQAAGARKSAEVWLNELIWRDFYIHILFHFPRVRSGNFRPMKISWRNDPVQFEAWKYGKTGYPVVDAAMRQMLQTGWMHNRARMIVASFLTKHLQIDWRWGEEWFMQHLIDGDPAANNGGWQWTAGTGTDAAPYFRIFNPVLQGLRHDPQGVFIRRWVPELRNVPLSFLHQPWLMSVVEQRACGVQIGSDYPAPIVDHIEARQAALKAYQQVSEESRL